MSNMLLWHGQTIIPFWILVTGQPWWVQIGLNALNWPADGWVTTKELPWITPPPTGTSAVLTGVPLGTAPPDVADDVPEPAVVDDPADDVLEPAVVVLGAAPPVVGGALEPPHAASAAAAAAPAPPIPAARSTVRRATSGVASVIEVVVVSGCSDMAASCLLG
jgi:hypothetical protein